MAFSPSAIALVWAASLRTPCMYVSMYRHMLQTVQHPSNIHYLHLVHRGTNYDTYARPGDPHEVSTLRSALQSIKLQPHFPWFVFTQSLGPSHHQDLFCVRTQPNLPFPPPSGPSPHLPSSSSPPSPMPHVIPCRRMNKREIRPARSGARTRHPWIRSAPGATGERRDLVSFLALGLLS